VIVTKIIGVPWRLSHYAPLMGGYRPCESCDFARWNCLIYREIEKYNKEIGETFGKIINKIGKNRNFHIVSIDTESVCQALFPNFNFPTRLLTIG